MPQYAMRKWLANLSSLTSITCILTFVSCSSSVAHLTIDKFTLRNYEVESTKTPMVRGDQQRRLYGAITIEEHEARLGQYYEVRWNLKGKEHLLAHTISPDRGALVILRYRQASTASELKVISKQYPTDVTKGKIDFQIIGEDYKTNGRVLAWKAELVINGKILSSKQSFLWER